MLISHLYMIVKNWKLSRHLSMVNVLANSHIHAREYYSASKRNKVFTHSLF